MASREELLQGARNLVPVLRQRAAQTEALRCPTQETIDDLTTGYRFTACFPYTLAVSIIGMAPGVHYLPGEEHKGVVVVPVVVEVATPILDVLEVISPSGYLLEIQDVGNFKPQPTSIEGNRLVHWSAQVYHLLHTG
ncbi:hypothetical protein NKDENANG_03191 [Candidatus Entotheonellaceae bacterium PAL068K]